MAKKTERTAPPTHEDDPILTRTEAARRIGKSATTVNRWMQLNLVPVVRMPSGMLGVRQSHVDRMLETVRLNNNGA